VLPASSTLERLVASTAAQTQQSVFIRIAEHLTPALCEDLDALLNVAPGDYRSALLRLKEYPPEANAAAIRAFLDFVSVGQGCKIGCALSCREHRVAQAETLYKWNYFRREFRPS